MKSLFVFILLGLAFSQHSISDKCYVQFWNQCTDSMVVLLAQSLVICGYQYFVNRKGVPVSRDWIIHEFVPGTQKTKISHSYYYQYSTQHSFDE